MYVNGSAYTTAYAYAPGAESGQTTALVQEITQPGENHSYAYDNVGNIVSAARNGVTTTYAYDALGQLIRVNDPNDGTWTYEYDCGGNILSKKKYAYTTGTLGTVQQIVSYAYGDADWKDKLTRYNGVDIAYDAIGNPIHDGVWTYTWENGRQLRRMACDATIAEFVYNADGLRVQKTVNGVATNYTLHGKNIVHMTKGNAELHFWYDAQNRPAIVEFNGTKYGYLYNLQGDVIGLIDSANTEVVKYTYDAWGKPLSVTGSLANTIGYYNPFRYRGYVYDVETGLYYLRSRYYNPSWGRFVNADIIVENNMFSYTQNSVISYSDAGGKKRKKGISVIITPVKVNNYDIMSNGSCDLYEAALQYKQLYQDKTFLNISIESASATSENYSISTRAYKWGEQAVYDFADVLDVLSDDIGSFIDVVLQMHGFNCDLGPLIGFTVARISDCIKATVINTNAHQYTAYELTTTYKGVVEGYHYASVQQTFYKCPHPQCMVHNSGRVDVRITLSDDILPFYYGTMVSFPFCSYNEK